MTSPQALQSSQKPPNFIWIFGDQHREQAMSCAGDPNLNTPNLDRMATEGVRLRGIARSPEAIQLTPLKL